MSDFKFDLKLKKKIVGEFDVGHPGEWNLLIKPQFKDETLFVHLQCQFKAKISDEDKEKGMTAPMSIRVVKGFIKEGKFVPEQSKTINGRNEGELVNNYGILIESLIEDGFIKHGEMYLGRNEPDIPTYHKAEKPGMGSNFDISQTLRNMGTPGPITAPTFNPHIKMKVNKTVSPTNNTNNP